MSKLHPVDKDLLRRAGIGKPTNPEELQLQNFPDYKHMLEYWDEQQAPPAQPATTKDELVADLRAMGVEGRDVMVHSSYKALRPVEGGPQTVVDAFVEAVGSKGTLLFPTYDFQSWTESHYWDRQNTPSKMGIISEIARADARFYRTPHPILSYAHYGLTPRRAYLIPRALSHGYLSLFCRFEEDGGLLISIGALTKVNKGFDVGNVGFTITHHAEAMADAPYRMYKDFAGIYVDGGRADVRLYTAYVRKPGYRTAVSPAHQAMEDEGIIKNVKLGRSRTHVAEARAVCDWVREACHKRPELLREEVDEKARDK